MVEQAQNIQARWYAQSPDELARALDVSLAEGLREDDAARRLSAARPE
jgi:Ca2+-transporting ATPase